MAVGVNGHPAGRIVHMSSASAAIWPSTRAVAANFHMPRLLATMLTSMIS